MSIERVVYRAEREAIIKLRRLFPITGAKTLAGKIYDNSFTVGGTEYELARHVNGRSLLSIYSVIRRYDAKQTVAA